MVRFYVEVNLTILISNSGYAMPYLRLALTAYMGQEK
jgi:hypothetical protein